jgi:DNA-binding response OmpR family regulator
MNEAQTTSAEVLQPIPLTIDAAKSRALPVILLVEDEALVREVACDILEYEGYRVLKARNAQEAKTAFQRYQQIVRLLITDVVLPGQNGRDLASELRTACPTLRTVFVSGFPENAVTRHGMVEGEMLYLPKPFSAEALVRTVKQALALPTEAAAT